VLILLWIDYIPSIYHRAKM